MSNQAKFYDLPTEPPPFNRRVYSAAKLPFRMLWEFVRWVGSPWFWAMPFAMFGAAVVTILSFNHNGTPFVLAEMAYSTMTVGLVWTVYLGAVFAVMKILGAIFK